MHMKDIKEALEKSDFVRYPITKVWLEWLVDENEQLEFANEEWKTVDKLWKETVEKITKTADVIDERNQKLITALIEQRKRMELGYKEGFESETIFWTRCIWEIDEVLGKVNKNETT